MPQLDCPQCRAPLIANACFCTACGHATPALAASGGGGATAAMSAPGDHPALTKAEETAVRWWRQAGEYWAVVSPHIVLFLGRARAEPTGLLAGAVVLGVCLLVTLIGWAPLSVPAYAINGFVGSFALSGCGGTSGILLGFCSTALSVVSMTGPIVVGALLFVWLRSFENDIYFQIGLVVLIGLAAKNAILIVEFAQQGLLAGMRPVDAAVQAARLRFRPIVMTSLAFVFGVLPLAVATGAGAAARQSMGTGVVGGMLLATFVATVFVPLFFVLFARRQKLGEPATLAPAEVLVEERH